MKLAPIVAIVSLVAASASQAAIIYSASLLFADGSSNDALITDKSGALLTSGTAGTGYFDVSNDQVNTWAAAGDIASLAAHFQAFGTDNFVKGTQDTYGTTQGGSYVISTSLVPTGSQIGASIYTFITNGTSLGIGSQFALLSQGTLTADPAPPATEITYNLGAAAATIVNNGTNTPAGTTGTVTFSNADLGVNGATVKTIALVDAVPEASTALLGLLGVAGLVRRRR